MASGETVAVKVLATDSKQGEKEFQTEVTTIMILIKSYWLILLSQPAYLFWFYSWDISSSNAIVTKRHILKSKEIEISKFLGFKNRANGIMDMTQKE